MFLEVYRMRLRKFLGAALCAAVAGGFALPAGVVVRAQQQPAARRGEGTNSQRITVMRSRLESLRRTLNSAIATLNVGGEKKEQKATDDAASRLRGVERDVAQLLSEVNDTGGRVERAEKFDPADIDRLETAVAELNDRGEKALQETATERRTAASGAPASADKKGKKKKDGGGGFLGLGKLFGGGGDDEDKYAELLSGPQIGRDRQLFEEAAKLTRKSNYEGSRLLFSTVITTYPDSPYLPHAKLAIADTFYLEGTTSALIQAGNAYQEWLTFFPTDPLADEVMLKVAEVEMRQMGLPDRDVTHARKAEQRLKALLQQFPQTALRPEVEIRIREVQENLGMHSFSIGNFYLDRYERGVAPNPKGAQSRYREVVERYPFFSRLDQALYLLAYTYVQEEEPDEAVKHFQRILRDHPDSKFAEKAREQLDAIGAEKPDADPKARNKVPPPERGMMRRFLDQVLGTTPGTIDKDGVLIRKDSKEPALIDVIIDNKGVLPVTTPTAPVSSRRIAPARPVVQPQPQPKPQQPQPAPVQRDTTKPQPATTQPNTPPPTGQTVDGVKPPTAQPTATPTPPPGL
jgi:outer membrane protein assembly factor BamD